MRIVSQVVAVVLVSFTACMGAFAASSDQVWSVRMSNKQTLSVESTNLHVDFSRKQAWTIRNIKYMGEEIVGEHGANGCVVNAKPKKGMDPKDPWIGTGHGKEEVTSFSVLVDNTPHELEAGKPFTCKVIILRKESKMGPLGHNAQITFPESGDCIIEKHSYTVLEDLNKGFNFIYAFMHCNNNALDQWLALLENGKEKEGQAGKKKNEFSLRRDIKGIIFYSEAMSKGVVYVYPEIYKGADTFRNSIWDRAHDNKLYFRPEVLGNNFKVGDKFGFCLKVIPFCAQQTNWKKTGRALAPFRVKYYALSVYSAVRSAG